MGLGGVMDPDRPTAKTLDEEVPGLNTDLVWWHPQYRQIFPLESLPKKDRAALKRAGYRWCGSYWYKPFLE